MCTNESLSSCKGIYYKKKEQRHELQTNDRILDVTEHILKRRIKNLCTEPRHTLFDNYYNQITILACTTQVLPQMGV
jgi:hypothetical protein